MFTTHIIHIPCVDISIKNSKHSHQSIIGENNRSLLCWTLGRMAVTLLVIGKIPPTPSQIAKKIIVSGVLLLLETECAHYSRKP